YVRSIESVGLDQAYCKSVFDLIKSNVSQASRLQLTPLDYSKLVGRFVDRTKQKPIQIGVVECNDEQVTLFSNEISSRLRVRSHPLLISRFHKPDKRCATLFERMDYFVTTDYHFNELKHLASPYKKRILRLRLNPAFVPTLVQAAKRGSVLM